ncbi:1,4-alpha-glucan branching protein domain-containing protein [Actinosynnema pretiosum]|uniref:1,4-alpha-glucan branching protein n=1 Tax=Actinosynnema pretiosum TaxID=42197 RepID=A0A290ZD75_9PSEU|nr:glycoside hydrolase family 57 protein [Actinosynnema pretiosum]ATE56968.1 1,4-alpha-glucan branching protein [Actinosynnema pretiosum]
MTGAEGTFCLVLHSHLPWLAHHGAWPVGEEWLYQAWAHSYLPVVDLLERFAAEGRRDVLTLGVTPVLAAQLDDPYCLRGVHDWLGNWQLRAHGAAPRLPELAAREHREAAVALERFEGRWRHGFSPLLRPLVDSGVVELLGGPAAHPFQPLLDERLRAFALETGLRDTALRLGSRPEGIWAPECGYAPGMERGYAAAGVRRFLVDGPSLGNETWAGRRVGDSDVVCFGRDLEVSYRVWSPRVGYPGHPDYRDFHTYDHASGLKPSRVTGVEVAPEHKRPYDPEAARAAVRGHTEDFVGAVVARLRELRAAHGREALVVAAYDTELYGHWWHEGPLWLESVLRALPEAGVRVTTLRGAVEAGHVVGSVEVPASSWGAGKDWNTWSGPQVADFVHANAELQRELLGLGLGGAVRDPVADQAVREALLSLSSDWAFMVTKDSAADYARYRAKVHAERFRELAVELRAAREGADLGRVDRARGRAAELRALSGPFGHLDARAL